MAHERATLAAVAARLIIESELTDWSLARRKAAAELGLDARRAGQPSDQEIIAEIQAWHALYGGPEWQAQLRAQREYALDAMRALAAFQPVLVGPVAEGWAHAASEARIELTPDNPKEVEYALLDLGVDFTAQQTRDGATHIEVVDGDWPLRFVLRERGRAPDPRFRHRLTLAQLQQLLAEGPSTTG